MIRQYKILEKLGKGTFGIVYKVINEYESMIYVIKQISLNGLSKQQISQVYSEAKILSLINSKYVVKYRESFVEGEDLDIVMEYCDNGDLCNFLKRKKKKGIPLEEDLIWQIFIKITLGLTAMHKMKILHRDLKTLNIFLNKDMGIKIGDLGVAKELNQASFAKTLIGTPYYLSPEMCQDMPYNQKSDVWALGCILYELCTFRHPFNATNQGALIIKILNSNPEPIFNCYSSQLQYLVNHILEKNYEKRPNCWDLLNNPIIVEKAKQFGLYQDILDIFSYNNIITQNDYNQIVNITKEEINGNNLDCVPLDSESLLFGQKIHVEKINKKVKKNDRENKNNHNNRNNCLSVDKNKNKIKYTDISNFNLVNNIPNYNIYTYNENNNTNNNQFENQKENYYLNNNNIIINQNSVLDNKNKYFYPNKTEIFSKNFVNTISKTEMMI
jgi:NIMA (never in mitosis gene a)-related kinase